MHFVKSTLLVAGFLVIVLLLAGHASGPQPRTVTEQSTKETLVPARADLAEALFIMVSQRAAEAGLPQPTTLCEACTAAYLGQPAATIRTQCRKACGIRP